MKLVEVSIENFRGIRELEIPLDALTVLIGENNVGKSTILEAIRLVLLRGAGSKRGGQFSEYDFHLVDGNATPQTANPIKIILHFAEERENEWPEAIVQQLQDVMQIDGTGRNHVWLQSTGTFNKDAAIFETKSAFLNSKGAELTLKKSTSLYLLQRFVPLFFLSALRDASQEFGQKGHFWSGFLKSIKLPDDKRQEIEKTLQGINKELISGNEGLTKVIEKIADAKKLVPLNGDAPVVMEAIPTQVFDMAGKIQVNLKSVSGAKLPISRHGEGTQSLTVLLLFQAFIAVNLAEAYTPESSPILALEEPEAHLHPSAVRSLGALLESMPGQVFVSSHSGDLVSRVPITSIRRIYKCEDDTRVGCLDLSKFSAEELQEIDDSIRLTRGSYLFSRSWLLVEGETESHIMPFLFELMGFSQDQLSISILEFSQATDKGEPFIKLAKALGVQWFMMTDSDVAGTGYLERAKKYLEPGEDITAHSARLPRLDIEHEFWYNGFDGFIKSKITSNQAREITPQYKGNVADVIRQTIRSARKNLGGKPALAQALVMEIRTRGPQSIPASIQAIIKTVSAMGA